MAKNKLRLDNALVEQGFFASRTRAQASIMAGEVLVNNEVETRADRTVLPEDVIALKEKSCPYVSRGGLKLAKALEHWHVDLTNKTCVDIGVATGGFSDCMLQAGAKQSTAWTWEKANWLTKCAATKILFLNPKPTRAI